MKKILILAFSLLLLFSFNTSAFASTTASSNELVESEQSIQAYPDREWFETSFFRDPVPYKYVEVKYGTVKYRGYLAYDYEKSIGDWHYYNGWLYREPLPYPSPFLTLENIEL